MQYYCRQYFPSLAATSAVNGSKTCFTPVKDSIDRQSATVSTFIFLYKRGGGTHGVMGIIYYGVGSQLSTRNSLEAIV